jgi:hypothetical protein
VYRRILGPVYDNKKEKLITNNEVYEIVKKKPHYNRDNKVK